MKICIVFLKTLDCASPKFEGVYRALGVSKWVARITMSGLSMSATPSVWGHWNGSATPSFVYTADQVGRDAALAAVPPNTFSGKAQDGTARGLREHSFHIGNDRVTLLGSNYATWRLRADEGGPKLLTDSDVDDVAGSHHTYGGGLGYLIGSSGSVLTTTAYNGSEAHLRAREFGCGYGRTTAPSTADGVSLTHTAAVMPGRDPAVLTEAFITNAGSTTQLISYREVWGTGMVHQLTGHGWGGWSRWHNLTTMLDRRAFTKAHFSSNFHNLSTSSQAGMIQAAVQSRRFLGLTAAERSFWAASYEGTSPLPEGASLWDETPPAVFIAVLPTITSGGPEPGASLPRTGPTTFSNSAKDFYGTGGFVKPSGGHATWRDAVAEGETALISRTSIELPPGASVTVRIVFGYLVGDEKASSQMEAIIQRAAASFGPLSTVPPPASVDPSSTVPTVPPAVRGSLADVARARWAPLLTRARVSGAPWVERELAWHSHVLLAGVSYDTHMNESIIDQGTAYRYYAGFQVGDLT